MYKDYYHLKSDPFSTHPNTGTFFVSETHKQAWYYLLFGIDTQEPFLVLTGDYGMGKTLLCLRLIKFLKEKGMARVEYIPTANEGYGGVLRRIAMSLGISPLPQDEEILQDMIYDSFRADTEKKRFYLIIDDVHELDQTFLSKLKYLSTFNHDEFFPVIMIFVGHPSFLQDLRTPALSSLNQRIKRRYNLARFGFEDTKNYIYFRLLKSGATGIPAFPTETIKKIFAYSGGVPRLINNICDTCLLIGASKQLATISPAVVDDAKNLVEGSLIGVESSHADEDAAGYDNTTETQTSDASFSEYLPSLPPSAANRPSPDETHMTPAQAETPEYQPEAPAAPKRLSVIGRKFKRAFIFSTAAMLLLLGIAAALFIYINYDKITQLFTNATTDGQKTIATQLEKIRESAPTLREESSEPPPGAAKPAGTGSIELTPAPAEPPAKNAGPAEKAATREHSVYHPFSLRSSSYQQLEMAMKEVAEIQQMGLVPYLVKADLGPVGSVWRTYIGFYTTEAEAQKIKNNYKLTNVVVQKTEFACLIGEFPQESEVLSSFEKLRQSGYFPYVIQKEKNRFRLYVGAYERKAEAEAMQQELQGKGIRSQVVAR